MMESNTVPTVFHFSLEGLPGSGKTAVVQALEKRVKNFKSPKVEVIHFGDLHTQKNRKKNLFKLETKSHDRQMFISLSRCNEMRAVRQDVMSLLKAKWVGNEKKVILMIMETSPRWNDLVFNSEPIVNDSGLLRKLMKEYNMEEMNTLSDGIHEDLLALVDDQETRHTKVVLQCDVSNRFKRMEERFASDACYKREVERKDEGWTRLFTNMVKALEGNFDTVMDVQEAGQAGLNKKSNLVIDTSAIAPEEAAEMILRFIQGKMYDDLGNWVLQGPESLPLPSSLVSALPPPPSSPPPSLVQPPPPQQQHASM